jgi:short-subunit dehydrogenase
VALPQPSDSGTALITGASAGIGEAMARELASRGHGVTLVARRGDRLRALTAELSERHGVRAEGLDADLGDPAAREQLASHVAELGLEVEVLVNNAGFGASGNLAACGRDALLTMLRVNCEALLDLQALHLPAMVERGRGVVINIASTAAFQPMPGTATYGATKAFVLSLSEAVHEELKGTGVTVTAVCPGPVKTEFMEVAGIAHAEDQLPNVFWMESDAVAKAAVDGAERGKRVVVPGLFNRAGAVTGQHTPRMLALPLVKRIWRQAV